jgi:hypothetical protein
MVHTSGLDKFVEDGLPVVATVDGSQGQEAAVLIVSMVKPRPTIFLYEKCLYVMQSRTRRQAVIVASQSPNASAVQLRVSRQNCPTVTYILRRATILKTHI